MHDRSPETLRVFSSTFVTEGELPQSTAFDQMGCTGENRSPAIAWSDAPENTKTFAVICHDPDAPTGVGFFHWLVANIPAGVHELPEGAGSGLGMPSGVVNGHNDYGFNGYGGPCPPKGDAPHHYEFTVYALANELDVDPSLTGAKLRFMTRGNILASGTIVGRYGH